MKIGNAIQTVAIGALVVFAATAAAAQRGEQSPATLLVANQSSQSVLLKLVDGSSVVVDEATESEQGVWYRRGGMNHLIARERVKTIERGPAQKSKSDVQVARVVATDSPGDHAGATDEPNGSATGPLWIYLVGGARMEVDSVTESAVGAWYRRGPLTVFVERARIDHIERKVLETLAESDSSSRKARGWTTGNQRIDSFIKQSGAKYGVDPYLIFCVMEQESHFNAHALSPKGARGLMQLMPGTSTRLGVKRPSDPAQNIAGGTRYLKQLIQQFKGRIDLVLASYNAGEGAVMKFGGKVPPYRETRDYVKRISFRYRGAKQPVAKRETTISGAGQ